MKILFVSLLLFSFSVFAEDSYLEVNGITSKASSKNSLVAKQLVFSDSLSRAFGKMLHSYFPEVEFLPEKIQEKDIQHCLYDYSIDQEKFSGKTYIAKFSFRFSKDAVVKILKRLNLVESENKKSDAETIAIYTQDYLNSYDQLKDYKVLLFSPERMILEIPVSELKNFLGHKVAFAKIDAQIRS